MISHIYYIYIFNVYIFIFSDFLHFTFYISPPYLEWPLEREKVKKAADHCRQILNYVNQAVKEAENKQVRREKQEDTGWHSENIKLALPGICEIIIQTIITKLKGGTVNYSYSK